MVKRAGPVTEMDPMDVRVRDMTPVDWASVAAIYQAGMDTGNATFETVVPSWSDWDQARDRRCRLVAETDSGVVGVAALRTV